MIYLSPPPECYSVVSFQTLIEITTSYCFPDIGEIFRFIKKIKEKKRKNISHSPLSFSFQTPISTTCLYGKDYRILCLCSALEPGVYG